VAVHGKVTLTPFSLLLRAAKSMPNPAAPKLTALAFTVIMDGLDRPTSLEFIGNTAYFVTLTGEIWKIDGVSK
jgi:hypothetical protein